MIWCGLENKQIIQDGEFLESLLLVRTHRYISSELRDFGNHFVPYYQHLKIQTS